MGNLSEQVRIQTPIDRLWRRDASVAQSALTPKADNGISVTLNEVDLADGQWITFDANGDVVASGTSPTTGNVFMVFRGGPDRSDSTATEAVTLLLGQYEAFSKVFDSGDTFANGSELAATNGQLELAVSGDVVVGHAFGAVADGELHFHTYNAGYVKA